MSMTGLSAKVENDFFYNSGGEEFNRLRLATKYDYQDLNIANDILSSSSTSGHFSHKADNDKMSDPEKVNLSRENSGHKYSGHSRSPSNSCQYSDSFDSEDSGQDTRRATPASRRNKRSDRSVRSRPTPKSNKSFSSASTNVGKAAKKKTGRTGTGTKSVGNSSSRTMSLASSQKSPRTASDVSQRMLSAKGHTISRLRNELEEIKLKCEDTLTENRLLKQVQRCQEKALSKYQNEEEELPQLLKKHSAELDNLNRRIRRYQLKDKEKERRAKEQHEQLLRTKDELQRLQELAADKGLKERDQLRRRADQVEDELEEKDKRLMDLEKYVENMKKNHRRLEHHWRVKELDIKKRFKDAEMERDDLRVRLREKERELDVRNIYSKRYAKEPARARTMSESNPRCLSIAKSISVDDLRNTTPPRADAEHSPRPPILPQRSRSFNTIEIALTPQDDKNEQMGSKKAAKDEKIRKNSLGLDDLDRSFESKKVEEEQRLEKVKKDDPILTKSPKRDATFEKKKEERVEEKEDDHLKILRMLDADVQSLETRKPVAKPANADTTENKTKTFGSTDNGTYKPTWLFGDQTEVEKSKENEKYQEQIKDLSSPRKEEDKESFPFFGSTKPKAITPQDTKQGLVNSVRDLHKYSNTAKTEKQEEKKDGIVFDSSWMKSNGEVKTISTQENNYQKKKELLLKKMIEVDAGDARESAESGKTQKEYKFTEPVENLHHGRPSHPELSPKSIRKNFAANNRKKSNEIDVEEISFGSYAPTFNKPKEPKQEKKSNNDFSNDFWGDNINVKQGSNASGIVDNGTKTSFGGESVFSTSTKARPVADSGGLPWESSSRAANHSTAFNANGKQNTMFATKPYNQQKSPFAAKPITTSGMDDADDDIEEFIL